MVNFNALISSVRSLVQTFLIMLDPHFFSCFLNSNHIFRLNDILSQNFRKFAVLLDNKVLLSKSIAKYYNIN